MEFYQTSKTELLFESMWSAFDWANGGCVYGLMVFVCGELVLV